jgi:Zn-finger protein
MFCYCPLYMLGDRCGGNFTFTKDGIKNCKDCLFPHLRENYDRLMARYPEIAAVVAANTGEKPKPPDAVPPENSRDTPPEPPDT